MNENLRIDINGKFHIENVDIAIGIISSDKNGFLFFGEFDKDSLFPVASLTKPVVSVAFLELLKEKKIDINTKLYDLGLIFANKSFENLTLKHLLTHHSGIKNTGKLFKEKSFNKYLNEILFSVPASFPFEYFYANTNYNLLRFVVEKITGSTFENFMNLFFQKLKMDSAVFGDIESDKKIKGTLYDLDGKVIKTDRYPDNFINNPSFNLVLTPDDLLKFLDYVKNNYNLRNVSPVMKKTIFKSGITDCSFNYEDTEDGFYLERDGLLALGFESVIRIIPEKELYYFILSSDFTVNVKSISSFLTKYFTGGEYLQEIKNNEKIKNIPPLPLGFYKGYESGIVEIFKKDEKTYLNIFEEDFELLPYDERSFYYKDGNFVIDVFFNNEKIFLNGEPLIEIPKCNFPDKRVIALRINGFYSHDFGILPDIEIFSEENRIFLIDSGEEFEIFLLDNDNELIVPDYGRLLIGYDDNKNVKSLELEGFERYLKVK